ncbi:MAG: tRNA (guanosine(37)-N1)-methyltransferase TrmD [Planctomycetes bacterium]|nr:tRNA (guanosine(37)-N1)-methyltransferase TrmD [Planctomycetota bacterium]
MRIDCITLFPEMFEPWLGTSIMRIAREKGLVDVVLVNLRDFAEDRRGTVDDRPFGGGPGMVLKPEPVVRAVESMRAEEREGSETRLILLTPQGEPFNQEVARELATRSRLVLVAGHYEGFDERVRLILRPRELSIGDYVLSGGELPAMVVIEAVVRLIPGVLGDERSAEEESFEAGLDGLLEYPQYTRPREFRGYGVPEVLLKGDHGEIARWRRDQARRRTDERRQDLRPEDL